MLEYFQFDGKQITADEWDEFVDCSDNGTMFIKTTNINEEKIQQLLKPDLEKWLN